MKAFIGIIMLVISTFARGQQFTDTMVKEGTFEKKGSHNTVVISNINGSVHVTGYDGDKVVVEVTRLVRGKTEARLEKGKQTLRLGTLDLADTLIYYVIDGVHSFGRNRGHEGNWNKTGYGYDWNCKHGDCEPEFGYKMDFKVKVPAGIHVVVSTINDGNIHVDQVRGVVRAHNINGAIRLKGLAREATASTINGDVDIDYAVNPENDCRFYSLNGDINANFRKGLAAVMAFESFNGEFFTNIDQITSLPMSVEQSSKGEGIKYKVNGNRFQLGKGGKAFLDFETFNGNVYLKEN